VHPRLGARVRPEEHHGPAGLGMDGQMKPHPGARRLKSI